MSILLDQLMGEREFLRYCREDYLGGVKNDIEKELFLAAMRDGFLKPIAYTNDDKKESLFSPFQIYVISSLSNNIVIDGGLSSKHNIDFHKSLGQRFVSWGNGGYSFNFNYAKQGLDAGPNDVLRICDDYNNFLSILHSCPMLNDFSDEETVNNRRLFTAAPNINFDFLHLSNSQELLTDYDLSLKKLSELYVAVGRYASDLDPLKNWYYYISRHPRTRKDELRGTAAIAQDMYIICELIDKMMRFIDGKTSTYLFEKLDKHLLRMQMLPSVEYAEGVDSKVLLHTISLFDEWVALSKDNAAMVDSSTVDKLSQFKKELEFYIEKYGDRYYQSGIREVSVEHDIAIKDLDEQVLAYLMQYIKQAPKGKSIQQEEYAEEIARAIEWRLDHLSRELWSILDEVGKKLQDANSKAWDISHNTLGEIRNLKQSHELYQIAVKTQSDRDDFYSLLDVSRKIYCASCRENFVQLHVQNNDSIVTYDHLCDECINNTLETRKKKLGQWHCIGCGVMLVKFVNQNVLSEYLQSGQLLNLKLEYGKLNAKITCKGCKTENEANIDWGWNP